MIKLKFLKRNGLLLNWREFDKLDHAQKTNTLSMIAPITNEENKNYLNQFLLKTKLKLLKV